MSFPFQSTYISQREVLFYIAEYLETPALFIIYKILVSDTMKETLISSMPLPSIYY